jgi:hypothetical protein
MTQDLSSGQRKLWDRKSHLKEADTLPPISKAIESELLAKDESAVVLNGIPVARREIAF